MPIHTVREIVYLGKHEISDRCEAHIVERVLLNHRSMMPMWMMDHFDPVTWTTLIDSADINKIDPRRIKQAVDNSPNHKWGKVGTMDLHKTLKPNLAALWQRRRKDIADVLFELFCHVATRDFEYVYGGMTSVGLFTSDTFSNTGVQTSTYLGNCQALAKNFVFLLTYFGFNANQIKLEAAPPPSGLDRDDIRLLGKAKEEISTRDVSGSLRGHSRIHEHHDPESRGFRLVKKSWPRSGYNIKQHYRDPFTTHWAVDLSAFGLNFKTFDPLCGLKYRNGMSDRFHEYRPLGSVPSKYGRVMVFVRLDDPRYRMYEIPSTLQFNDGTFRRIYAKYSHMGPLWMVVDPDDWGPRNTRPGAQNRNLGWMHPPNIAQVYGM